MSSRVKFRTVTKITDHKELFFEYCQYFKCCIHPHFHYDHPIRLHTSVTSWLTNNVNIGAHRRMIDVPVSNVTRLRLIWTTFGLVLNYRSLWNYLIPAGIRTVNSELPVLFSVPTLHQTNPREGEGVQRCFTYLFIVCGVDQRRKPLRIPF